MYEDGDGFYTFQAAAMRKHGIRVTSLGLRLPFINFANLEKFLNPSVLN